MGFFTNLRADRLLAEVKASAATGGPALQKAITRLRELGPGAIEPIFATLPESDKPTTLALVDILSSLVSQKTFPSFVRAMVEGSPKVVSGASWALSSSRNFPPHLLLEAFAVPGISKTSILDVINSQKSRFGVRELLSVAAQQEPGEKAALFRIVAEIADVNALPELIGRLHGKDAIARVHLITLLGRFNLPEVRTALQAQLKDPNKLIRAAALAALARVDGPYDIELVCSMLRDPELDVQNKAIDLAIKANEPMMVRYLIDVLKDENEYARRAAVEVLNEVGDEKSVKYLLGVLQDTDWWVRSRAADALGKIGGPRVIDAVLQLIKDKDENIRRSAIEILNQTKDERAVDELLKATHDPDWWVSERAVDALAEIGSKRAVPRLVEMLRSGGTSAKTLPVVVRALGRLGEPDQLEALVPLLSSADRAVRLETMQAMARLADESWLTPVRAELQAQSQSPDQTISRVAASALREMETRLSGVTVPTLTSTQPSTVTRTGASAPPVAAPGTMLLPEATMAGASGVMGGSTGAMPQAATAKLDITTLRAGDMIEGRYKFIERIGRGAFGTVLLVEDTVVDDRLILKFLNANVAQDEEVMKRFVHELRYSRKITHHNVIRIYDFLYIQGLYAISMEYFKSHTLGAEIVGEKPIELKRALQFGIDICTGMAVAHQVGIVHRDLKPANVLIDDAGLLKIVDFGVAAAHREGDTQLTKTGYVIGSPKYMAPEQILGKKVDERADIYALGVILYEMVTGVAPYARGDHMAVMYQHVQGKARPPKELNPALPQELCDVVMKAMAVDKNKRFQSMDELRTALQSFL